MFVCMYVFVLTHIICNMDINRISRIHVWKRQNESSSYVQIWFLGTLGHTAHKSSRLLTRQDRRKFICNCDILRMKKLNMHSGSTSTLCIWWQEDIWKNRNVIALVTDLILWLAVTMEVMAYTGQTFFFFYQH